MCFVISSTAFAQFSSKNKRSKVIGSVTYNKKIKEDEKFLEKQWWIGLKGGVNLSKALVTTSYSALSPSNYELSETKKEYESFNKLGSQLTLEVTLPVQLTSI
jgi:hypothetical protein